jgi:hypothetical protein
MPDKIAIFLMVGLLIFIIALVALILRMVHIGDSQYESQQLALITAHQCKAVRSIDFFDTKVVYFKCKDGSDHWSLQ